MQSESANPTFSTIGKSSAANVPANLSVDRVQVDLAGMAMVLDRYQELNKAVNDYGAMIDENLQSLCEGMVAVVQALNKISEIKPSVSVGVPEIRIPDAPKIEVPVNVALKTPAMVYVLLAIQAVAVCLILLKLFQE